MNKKEKKGMQVSPLAEKSVSVKKKPVLELSHIMHQFQQGKTQLTILRDVQLAVYPGELCALVGPSGSGKSTLLHIAGLLELPTQGHVHVCSLPCGGLGDEGRTRLRRQDIGFVYQFHHLLPEFTALENLMLPQMIAGVGAAQAKKRGESLLAHFHLSERSNHLPSQLSGGEQQRIAILRALTNRPKLLLADEPTGNLDEATAAVVFQELLFLVRQENMGALIATHDRVLARQMDRIFVLHQGLVQESPPFPASSPKSLAEDLSSF